MRRAPPMVVAVVATLAMTVSYLDRQTLSAIAPTVRSELGISHTELGWLGSGFAFAYLVGSPIAGRLVDRIGPRSALAAAFVGWSLVSALHALASSFAALFVLRVLLGALESPSFPAAARTIHTNVPPSRRSAATGLLFTGSSIGAMIAAPLATHLTHAYGFRTTFVLTAAIGCAWLPLWLIVAPSDEDTGPASAAPPIPAREVLGHRAFLRQTFVVLGSAPAILVVLSWYPQLLHETCGVPKHAVGHYLWVPPLAFDVAAIAFGIAASRRDRTAPTKDHAHHDLLALAALATSTLVLVPFVATPWAKVALGSVSLAGGAGMYVVGTADLLRRIDPRAAALAGGLSAAVQSIVHVTANPAFGAVVDRTHTWGAVTAVGLAAVPCAALWSLLARSPTPAQDR
ncbi:MAG: MFS transporter [Polyangiaceae bacterium]